MQSDTIALTLNNSASDQYLTIFLSGQESKFTWQELPASAAPSLELAPPTSDAFLMMLASEEVLRRDWETPEEDEAWADL